MSDTNDQSRRDTYAQLSKISYQEPDPSRQVMVNGATYQIIDTTSTSTGFQATVYQRDDKIFIAYRGTEAMKAKIWDQPVKDLGADYGMVKNKLNVQTAAADAFTQRVLNNVKKQHPDWNLHDHVYTTGHSLGATHAEREAAKYGLGGAGFNGFGAVDLSYNVPEGQPKNAPAFDEYVRATDVVSSASRHYGNVHVYATEQDVANLRAGRYLDTPNPAHPANPMVTADISAHFVNNFAPDPGDGESVMTAVNAARYEQYKVAFDHYRSDVMTSRIDLHDVLNHRNDPAQAERLNARWDDAIDVMRYRVAIGATAHMTIGPYERDLDAASRAAHAKGQSIHATSDKLAHGTQAAGRTYQSHAEQFSHDAHAAGQTLQQSATAVSRGAMALPDPLMAAGMSLGAMGAGYVLHAEAEGLARGAHSAGHLAHAAAEKAAQQIHAAGERSHAALDAVSANAHDASQMFHNATQRLASTQTYDAIVDKVAQVEHGAQDIHQRFEQKLEHTLHVATHVVSQSVQGAEQSASRAYDAVGQWFHHNAPLTPVQAHASSAPPHAPVQAATATDASHGRSDPRHRDSPDHALYNTLKERLPEASESRLVQFTAACHTHKITDQNLSQVFLNEQAGIVGFTSGGLRPAVASVDIKEPPPQAAQSIQQMQHYDQQQVQLNQQIHAQIAQTNAQGQHGPVLGGR